MCNSIPNKWHTVFGIHIRLMILLQFHRSRSTVFSLLLHRSAPGGYVDAWTTLNIGSPAEWVLISQSVKLSRDGRFFVMGMTTIVLVQSGDRAYYGTRGGIWTRVLRLGGARHIAGSDLRTNSRCSRIHATPPPDGYHQTGTLWYTSASDRAGVVRAMRSHTHLRLAGLAW
jgi:hypothetical protein